jgi:NAD(P) transhydrogenase
MPATYVSAPAHREYDLVVIGSGPGGQKAAISSAKLGKKVLVIEKDHLGGSCIHTGTIPSKALREAALSVYEASSLAAISERTNAVIQSETNIISAQLQRNKVEVVRGTGRFVTSHDVEVVCRDGKTHSVKANVVIIAVGTRPRRPEGLNFDNRTVFDSDTVLTLVEHPESMLVLGAGVIGCEYASIYAKMGIEVTLVDRRPSLLPSIDREIVDALIQHFKKYRIRLHLGWNHSNIRLVDKLPRTKRAGARVCLSPGESDENAIDIEFDTVLYCAGRTGNFEGLHLEKAGLKADDRGLLPVNSNYQTAAPHIYAVGDIIGAPALAASAAEQGRLAAQHAFSGVKVSFPSTFPYGIYTIPEISSVGAQEEDLKKAGIKFVTGIARYSELARGKILRDDHGFLKLLVDAKTEKILGVHVIGTGATELVHIGQTAMAFGAEVKFFVDNVFNYPTLAEAYKVAAYNAYNKLRAQPTT